MVRVARHVRVAGLVQGVFFRQSAVDEARQIGVAGWVRNCPDSSVEAHVEGDETSVQQMLDWLCHGPAHARVDNVTIRTVEPENVDGFSVKH